MTIRPRSQGSTLSEYGLIAALVLLGMLGVLFLLGSNFNQSLQGVRGDLAQNVQAAGGNLPGGVGIGGVIGPPGPGQQSYCTETGWCFNVPSSSQGHSATTGSMGQEMYSGMMRELLLQMEAMGIQDETLRSLLTQLSNVGHNIGQRQYRIASHCPPRSRCILSPTWDLSQIQTHAETFEQLQQRLVNYLVTRPHLLPHDVGQMVLDSTFTISGIAAQYQEGATIADAQQNAETTMASAANICTQGISGQCDQSLATVDAVGHIETP